MKVSCFLLLLFTVNAIAVTETFLRMPADTKYMSFVLGRYLEWHQKKFPSTLDHLKGEEKKFVDQLLGSLDHWVVAGHPEFPQFRIAHYFSKDGILHQAMRIYIQHEFRKSALLAAPQHSEPWFYELREDGERCLTTRISEKTFENFCRRSGSAWKKVSTSLYSDQDLKEIPNPFPTFNYWNYQTRDLSGKPLSVIYQSRFTHPSRTPRALDLVINAHTVDALLPMDKYEVDTSGNMTVFYP